MFLVDSIRHFRQSMQAAAALPAAPSLRPVADLTSILRAERARANRSQGQFSMLTFAATGQRSTGALTPIAQHLAHRVRLTDQFGWSSQRRLWLVLPDCPAEASLRLAKEICERFSSDGTHVTYDLYHYGTDSGSTHAQERPVREVSAAPTGPNAAGPAAGKVPVPAASVSMADNVFVRATPFWKRAVDVIVSLGALVVLSPVFAIVAAAIKYSSPGPVFFSQTRSGRAGRPFRMYKFRTMVVDAERRKVELMARNEQDGPAFKIEDDPRITRLGNWLRAVSIDELPQLWNVLRGEMSLVGPRPLPVDESNRCEPWQQERLDVTPGLTCTWQVSARHSKILFVDWMRMDIRYARGRSPLVDLRLILQTVAFVVRRKGI